LSRSSFCIFKLRSFCQLFGSEPDYVISFQQICQSLITNIIESFPNPRFLHLVDSFFIHNSCFKRLLGSRNLFSFNHSQTLVVVPARTPDPISQFLLLSFVGQSMTFATFPATGFSLSLFLFLCFSLGSDTRCRSFIFLHFSAVQGPCCLATKMMETVRNSSANYLSEQTWIQKTKSCSSNL